ncbi:alpha-mannosylglycoprotein 6-beta-N-acetylglucosaminyltransferase MGAT5 [Acrasis kona]|uniref:alpha-1,6-mannosyl-glycoprotein 6-beta-N-acetylglucosaminyltransferase n=1 Tax=Acrasis kona TaxID=1008807 RepID=A0AAW2Z669_9EUKA
MWNKSTARKIAVLLAGFAAVNIFVSFIVLRKNLNNPHLDEGPKGLMLTKNSRNVLVHNGIASHHRLNMKIGGPLGEFYLFQSLIAALKTIKGLNVVVASNAEEVEAAFKEHYPFWRVYTELAYATEQVRALVDKEKCSFRFIDFWGVSNAGNDRVAQSPLKHVFTPYNNSYNFFLGYITNQVPTSLIPKWKLGQESYPEKIQLLVWGKEWRYFTNVPNVFDLFKKIKDRFNADIVTTIRDAEGKSEPDFIKSYGIVDKHGWSKLLAESTLIMGLGDPVIGPTVFEAVGAGCIYLDPIKDPPQILHMNPEMQLTSQHHYANETLGGEPYVYQIKIDDHNQVLEAIERALKNRHKVRPFIPEDYKIESVAKRLRDELEIDDCNH